MIRLVPLLGIQSDAANVVLFFFVTAGLIVGSLLVAWLRLRDYPLVILGLLVAAASVGYGLLGGGVAATQNAPGANLSVSLHATELAGTLMKIAVVLVLAGVARSLFCDGPSEPVSTPPRL